MISEFSIALTIDSLVAEIIPISSISLLQAEPTETHNASELIKLKRSKRLFLVKRLLSSSS